MKKLTYLLLGLLAAATIGSLTACDDDDPIITDPDTLSVRPLILNFEADDTQAQSVTVETNVVVGFNFTPQTDENFTITRTDSGFTVAPKSVNQDEDNDRTLTITVTAGSAEPKTVEVTQAKKGGVVPPPPPPEEYLEIDPDKITFKAGEEVSARKVDVDTNIEDWDFSKTAEWITVQKFDDYITIIVSTPAPEQLRSDVVKVFGGEIERTVTVTQEAEVPEPETFTGFTAVGDFDPQAVPFFGTTLGYKYVMEGDYTGDFDLTIEPVWTIADGKEVTDYYTVTISNGIAADDEDPARRYLRILIAGNDSETDRDVMITITPRNTELQPASVELSQGAIVGDDWSGYMKSVKRVLDRFAAVEGDNYEKEAKVFYDAENALVRIEYIYETVSFGGTTTNRWSDITLFIKDDAIYTKNKNYAKHAFQPDRYRQLIAGVNGNTAYEPETFTDPERDFSWEVVTEQGRQILRPKPYMLGNITVSLGLLMADDYGYFQNFPCIGAWTDISISR